MIQFLFEAMDGIRGFLEEGGSVLWLLFFTLVLLWVLMMERFLYLKNGFPPERQSLVDEWQARSDQSSWYARQIRQAKLSQAATRLNRNLSVIKTLVALFPLMGLLGTAMGMIQVFDVMAHEGTGNVRLMASGISIATLSTMSGMVAALSGIYFASLLESKVKRERQQLGDDLEIKEA